MSEHCYTWYLKDADSYFNISFKSQFPLWSSLGQKSQSCSFLMKIGTHGILEVQICKSGLRFLKFGPPKSIFGQIWTEKLSCPVWLKIGIQSVSTMLILIPTWHTRSYTRSCTRTYTHTRSYFDISFLKFQTYILRMLILILRFFLYRS